MSRTRSLRRVLAASAVAALSASLLSAAPASAADSIADCLAQNVGITDIVCHEVTKLPGTPTVGEVKMSWQMVPGSLDTLEGGLWMTRTPIKGQRTGGRTDYPTPNSGTRCSDGNPAGFQDCFTSFGGQSGSIVLKFPLSMAGFQYVLHASEKLSNVEGDIGGADLFDNTPNTVVWVNKAYRYKVNGKTVVKAKCPTGMMKKCTAVVVLDLNSDVGNGVPVSPVN